MTTVSNIGGTSNRKFLVGKSGLNFESGADGQSATININSTVVGNVDTSGVGTKVSIVNKTQAYNLTASDLGKIINCTGGTFTVSLTAATTLGAGFNCWIWNTSNTSTDAITIDPNLSETIDGRSTLVLRRGEGLQIVCDGTNWQTGDKKAMRGYAENVSPPYFATASGTDAIALGRQTNASGQASFAVGDSATASALGAFAVGAGTTASSARSTALGANSAGQGSQAVTGAGAMALGGSYASGTDSFAAAIANNTASYGASGTNAIAIGYQTKVTGGAGAAAIGYGPVASGNSSIAIGYYSTASGVQSFAFGYVATASATYAMAFGPRSSAAQIGKQAFASGCYVNNGDAQSGKMVLRTSTTTDAVTVLTSDGAASGTTNQVVLPNDSTFSFSILVVARRTDVDNESAGYKFEGVIDRNTGAATTAIVGTVAKTVLAEDSTAWDCNVSADTTNGGLKIEVTGEAGKTIRWVATVWTSEVTG